MKIASKRKQADESIIRDLRRDDNDGDNNKNDIHASLPEPYYVR